MARNTLRKRYGHMAPTALIKHGCRFGFYSSDVAEPPHVHVKCGDGEAKFWLQPIALDWSVNMKAQEIRRARKLIEANHAQILARWRRHFAAR